MKLKPLPERLALTAIFLSLAFFRPVLAEQPVPAALEPLQAKIGRHWAFDGTVLDI